MFLETIRKPEKMIQAFELAKQKKIPIIVLKTGRTERSAELTVSHSGGLAGVDDYYNALFKKYGIQRVADMDELATTLIMFDQPYELADGNMVSIHDSEERGNSSLILPINKGLNLQSSRTAPLKSSKRFSIRLPPVNPLDAWGKGLGDADQIMADSITEMLDDPNFYGCNRDG